MGLAVAVVLSIVGLVTAFFVMIDSNFGAALGAALLPAIILWYLYTKEVRSAFGILQDDAA